MNYGDALIVWTARAAMTFYALSLAGRAARALWVAGCLTFLLHVVAAFHYRHNWSHAAAYESTARQTAADIGVESGVGIYMNYLFGTVWIIDAAWWGTAPVGYTFRPKWVKWVVHGFMGFMAFNATIVFAAGPSRWLGIAACCALLARTTRVFVRGGK